MHGTVRRIRRVITLAILVIAFAVPFNLLSTTASLAITKIDSTSTSAADQATSYWYFQAMKLCFSKVGDGPRTELRTLVSEISSSQLFYSNSPLSGSNELYGFYPRGLDGMGDVGDDGQTKCDANTSSLSVSALRFWDIDPFDFVCNGLGYGRENGKSALCTDTSLSDKFTTPDEGDYDFVGAFTTYIKDKVYGGKDPNTLSGAGKYTFYKQTLLNACVDSAVAAKTSKPAGVADNVVYGLNTAKNGTTVSKSWFTAYSDRNHSWGAYVEAGSSTKTTCKGILDKANENFDAWYGTEILCRGSETFKSDAGLIAACINGSANSTNKSYCTSTYPEGFYSGGQGGTLDNDDKRLACYIGQGRGNVDKCKEGTTALPLAESYTEANGLLEACERGSLHPDDTTYCTTAYPYKSYVGSTYQENAQNKDKNEACKYGQGIGNPGGDPNGACSDPNDPTCAPGGDDAITCGNTVEVIGWVVCPALNAMAGFNDVMWNFTNGLLTTSALQQYDPPTSRAYSQAYTVWMTFRSIANVLLVIMFLFIIFSQVSGIGASNYGIKKSLPRLIVVAILINVSFYVMQIAVDLMNVIGGSLYGAIVNVTSGFKPPDWGEFIGAVLTGGAAGALGVGALIAGLAIAPGATLLFLLPFAITALFGFLAAVITLIFRQAIIPILAIFAPIAFVLFLLPNTKTWFDKWLKLFLGMLLLYPLAALLFGGLRLGATIIGDAFVTLIITAIPLFLLPFLASKAGPMLDKVNGAVKGIGGQINKPVRSLSQSMSENSKAKAMLREPKLNKNGKARFGALRAYQGFQNRRIARDQATSTLKSAAGEKFTEDFRTTQGANVEKYLGNTDSMSEGTRESISRTMSSQVNKAEQEGIKNLELSSEIKDASVTKLGEMLESAVKNGETTRAQAIQNKLFASGGTGQEQYRTSMGAIDAAGAGNPAVHGALESNILNNHGNLKSSAADIMENAIRNTNNRAAGSSREALGATTKDAAAWKLNDREFAGQNEKSQLHAIKSGAVESERAAKMLNDARLAENFSESIVDNGERKIGVKEELSKLAGVEYKPAKEQEALVAEIKAMGNRIENSMADIGIQHDRDN